MKKFLILALLLIATPAFADKDLPTKLHTAVTSFCGATHVEIYSVTPGLTEGVVQFESYDTFNEYDVRGDAVISFVIAKKRQYYYLEPGVVVVERYTRDACHLVVVKGQEF